MEVGGQPDQTLYRPRRNPDSIQSPLSNTPTPRDFLSQRSGVQNLLTDTNKTEPLRNSPHASHESTASPDADILSHELLASDMPSIANPHSPRPLHSQDTENNAQHGQRNVNGPSGKRSGASKREKEKKTPAEQSNNLRSVAASVLSNDGIIQSEPTPPGSPVSTTSMSKEEHTIAKAALPRNSSIESGLSSISSLADQSHKSQLDTINVNSPEIRHLISTAGSAEILISLLIKEKQHAASQNAQLWKLVDKQRSLLMGLNQDLERAIKDKEKYRRRLKEVQLQPPPPHQSELPVTERSRTMTEEVSLGSQSPATVIKISPTPPVSTPNNKSLSSLHSSPLDLAMVPSPLQLLQNQQKLHVGGLMEPSQTRDMQQTPESTPEHTLKTRLASVRLPQSENAIQHQAPRTSFLASPSPTETQGAMRNACLVPRSVNASLPLPQPSGSTPVVERPDRASHPTRKPPPAPLNLKQAKSNSSVEQNLAPAVQSDSRDNGPQDVDGSLVARRGRRKTREEDDRDRELTAQRQEEARSRSSKSSKSSKVGKKKSKQELSLEAATTAVPTLSLPTSPRQLIVAPASEDVQGGGPPAPSSIAAVLSPDASRAAPIVERTLAAPPMSPGLPVSPRPADRPLGSPMPRLPRERAGIPLSPPLSPRGAAPGLPLSPRPPPRPAASPADAPLATSIPCATDEHLPQSRPQEKHEMSRPTSVTNASDENVEHRGSPLSPFHGVQVDRALMDPAYPDLLLPPKALSSILVKVASSRLRPKRHSHMVQHINDEDPVFTLSIFSRSDGRELWRIEKAITALPQLDQQMKNVSKFSTKLPERKLFSGHSPAIIDARRNALNHYFGGLLEATIDERSALAVCQFLSSDVIEARDDETNYLTPSHPNKPALAAGSDSRSVKEGYLTKRGKNFGGWKVRYFNLTGSELKYFDSPGGTHLGTIKLQDAQIGKQTQTQSPSRADDDVENQYRHAFLVLEPKRKDSSSFVRHVLCAESDQERDEWVRVMVQNVDNQLDDEHNKQQDSHNKNTVQRDGQTAATGSDELKVISYEQVAAGTAPTIGASQVHRRQDATPSPASTSSVTTISHEAGSGHDPHAASQSSKSISAPKNGGKIQDAGSWGNKPVPQTTVKDKKRSMWGFRQRGGSDSVLIVQPTLNPVVQSVSQNSHGLVRAVFGLPLAEAVDLCPPRGVDVNQPAVVYRCIEYLRAKDAASEEGIFRLSGSNLVIRALRERFNTEGDVNFLTEDQYYDVHAVASLFKLYLRELPTTVLTKELHFEFLTVLKWDEKSKKVAEFNRLVHELPPVNLALLRALSQYLIEIVSNSDRNKMNVRNMGIVFSPTLNIPAPVFGMFLTDFEAIFGKEPAILRPAHNQTRPVELSVPTQLTAEDIRSPRHQMFSDLPTPAYNQTAFPEGPPPGTSTQKNLPWNPDVAQNTGFIPVQPSYESRTYISDPQAAAQPQQQHSMVTPLAQRAQHGSMNMMMTPANAATPRAKRRESSMVFMGTSHQKISVPKMRDDSEPNLVTDNTFD